MSVQPLPATEQTLVLFAAFKAQSCCYSTIKVYLSAVRHLHISKGLGDPLSDTLQLNLVLKGIRRKKPRAGDARLPITPLILKAILGVVKEDPHSFINMTMWAACCLGYFAWLRSGEFTCDHNFDPNQHLTDQDIAVDDYSNPTLISVHLKKSKTDQEGVGVTLFMGRTGMEVCPVTAILPYLVVRRARFASGPLFVNEKGSPLSRIALVTWLRSTLNKAGIDSSKFSGHSFRIGAASVAAARGVEDSTIQTLGRWKSESFKRYIRMPREELARISQIIAH